MALFGQTAAECRRENPGKEGNIRDHAIYLSLHRSN